MVKEKFTNAHVEMQQLLYLLLQIVSKQFIQIAMTACLQCHNGKRFEAIDVIEDFKLNFNLGNVIKYVLRSRKKEDYLKDLKKAQ
jgi:hypothetical protein